MNLTAPRHSWRLAALLIGILLLLVVTTAQGQQQPARYGTSARSQAVHGNAQQTPMVVRSDGTVLADFGGGYERIIRACSAYRGQWPASRARAIPDRPPQGGVNSPPPGANGLPPAPGSGTSQSARVGNTTSSLKPLHGAWRSAGPASHDGACYVVDSYGRLHLIPL